jgi:hypothetical protein
MSIMRTTQKTALIPLEKVINPKAFRNRAIGCCAEYEGLGFDFGSLFSAGASIGKMFTGGGGAGSGGSQPSSSPINVSTQVSPQFTQAFEPQFAPQITTQSQSGSGTLTASPVLAPISAPVIAPTSIPTLGPTTPSGQAQQAPLLEPGVQPMPGQPVMIPTQDGQAAYQFLTSKAGLDPITMLLIGGAFLGFMLMNTPASKQVIYRRRIKKRRASLRKSN